MSQRRREPNNIAALLNDFAERAQKAQEEIDSTIITENDESQQREDDEEARTNHPIYDDYVTQGGDQAIMTMTNFTDVEFRALYAVVEMSMNRHYTRGRGRKPSTRPMDAFFILLAVLKFYTKWEKAALDWKMKTSTFEALIKRTLDLVTEPLASRFIQAKSMETLRAENCTFPNHPDCMLGIDVRFQTSNRPKGIFEDSKQYWSGKHWAYGLKTESAHLPNGQVAYLTKHYPGSTSDFSIFSENIENYRALLKKDNQDLTDQGRRQTQFPDMWGLIADRGYQGAQDMLRAYTPKKGRLSPTELAENIKIAKDRIIVENFYGRGVSLWGALRDKWRWSHEIYPQVEKLTYALTNYHISLNPLRAADGNYYQKVITRYIQQGKAQADKEKKWRDTSKYRRRRRLEASQREQDDRFFRSSSID